MFTSLRRVVTRAHELGMSGLYRRVQQRITHHYTTQRWRTLEHMGYAQTPLYHIVKGDWEAAWQEITCNIATLHLHTSPLLCERLELLQLDPTTLRARADEIVAGALSVFGTPLRSTNNITWHSDPTIENATRAAPWHPQGILPFYAHVLIDHAGTKSGKQADPKFPWELSRLQHLVLLGRAWQYTQASDPTRATLYTACFVRQITSWLDANPFMRGINWCCPMEVALRAINLIWACSYFYADQTITPIFWQRYVSALYHHAQYLIHNWEWADPANNHYLADLLGAWYLSVTLGKYAPRGCHPAFHAAQFTNELMRQLLPTDWAYEGSTAYHRLDTDMATHATVLAEMATPYLAPPLHTLTNAMCENLDRIALAAKTIIQIGDNDSGCVVSPFIMHPVQSSALNTWHDHSFGISIIRTPHYILSFRHHIAAKNRPTGHLHGDALSITISVREHEIIIDPGTGLYTGNPTLRNWFRSCAAHATIYIRDEEMIPFRHHLFAWQNQMTQEPICTNRSGDLISLRQGRRGFLNKNTRFERSIKAESARIVLSDYFENAQDMSGFWNLPLHPAVTSHCSNDLKQWILRRGTTEIIINSSIPLKIMPSSYSPGYGIIEPSRRLCGTMAPNEPVVTTILIKS